MSANGISFSVGPEVVAELAGDFDARGASYVDARARFRASLERRIQEAYAAEFTRRRPGTLPTPLAVRRLPELDRALDRIWPAITAPELVRQLLASEERIERAASGVLNETEKRLLYRKPVERLDEVRWSPSDLPLVDEIQELIEPEARGYGHVVLDEAQDLTPMQLRMVGRRIAGGSVTVLGDLAQATGLWSYPSWDEVAEHLGVVDRAQVEQLTHAYRVPREIMELALPMLELTAPSIKAPIPFRPGGQPPEFIQVDRADRFEEAVTRARAAHEQGGTTTVIAPPSCLEHLRAAFQSSGLEFGDAETGTLSTSVQLLDPIGSKGLEFDHVVVLEPAAIIREAEGQGQRDLYVALTRATRTLTCIHSEPLPWPLGSQFEPPNRQEETGAPAAPPTTTPEAMAVEDRPQVPAISVGEALVLARLRGIERDVALARALLALAGGASESEAAAAIIAPDLEGADRARELLEKVRTLVREAAGNGS